LSRTKRKFNLGHTIETASVLTVLKFLANASDKDTAEITLKNNSGGCAYSAIQLVEAVRTTASKVKLHCDGYLASAAAYIYFGCNQQLEPRGKGQAPIFIMYHKPRIPSPIDPRKNIFSKDFPDATCQHVQAITPEQKSAHLAIELSFDAQASMLFDQGASLDIYNNFHDVCFTTSN